MFTVCGFGVVVGTELWLGCLGAYVQGFIPCLEKTANQKVGKPLYIRGVQPNLPIMHRLICVGLCIFYGMVQNSYAQLSLHTHSPKDSCAYGENTRDSYDIPRYTTRKPRITSMHSPVFMKLHGVTLFFTNSGPDWEHLLHQSQNLFTVRSSETFHFG